MADTKLDIRVYPIDEPKGNTVAFASVAIDDLVAIRGVRVVEGGEKGKFVSMPQSQDMKTEKYYDIAQPVSDKLRNEISKAVLEEYDQQTALAPDQRGYAKPETAAENINAAAVKLNVYVYPIKEPQGNVKAFASVAFDNKVNIRGVRVFEGVNKEGENKLYVSMPQSKSEKDGKTEYHDIAFPINGDLRKAVNKAVLDKYESKTKSLTTGLRNGADKAAEQGGDKPRNSASKSKPGIGD